LRAIRGFTEILAEDWTQVFDDSARHHIDRIIRSAEEMDMLIRDLLKYSQVSRGKLQLAPVSLDKVFGDLRGQFEMELEAKGGSLAIDPALPSVLAHETTLRQAMANLLSNAVKFVKAGEKPQVRVRVELVNECVRICVEDNGIGIAPEHQQRIFGVFERLNTTGYSGTGIGLAIVRRAVERMGGQVGVESKLGEGSRFYVDLQKAS
jgi:signal transduction histidine kinase